MENLQHIDTGIQSNLLGSHLKFKAVLDLVKYDRFLSSVTWHLFPLEGKYYIFVNLGF